MTPKNENIPAKEEDPVELQPQDEQEEAWVYYFAYGAMTNPVSRSRREVNAVWSRPAILQGYELTFAYAGFGNVVPSAPDNMQQEQQVHGVVMKLGPECWKRTKDIELGYNVGIADVELYDGDDCADIHEESMTINGNAAAAAAGDRRTVVRAHFFTLPHSTLPKNKDLPSERYLKIIAMGLRHHGVQEEYIQKVILGQEYIPEKKLQELETFPRAVDDTTVPVITWDDYQQMVQEQGRLLFVLNGRVFEADISLNPNFPAKIWLQTKLVGKGDCTLLLLRTMYNPSLPECESVDDITPLHQAWVEDELVSAFQKSKFSASHVYNLQSGTSPSFSNL